MHANKDYICIPLLKHPLASRTYMKHNGLRSTIAWAMSSLCPKKLNDCVILDPVCRVGAVLLEAAQEYSNAVFLGMDLDFLVTVAESCREVKASGMEGRVQLLQSSAIEIPLADGTVDAVLCDVPFGRKFSCSYVMPTVLPCLLREMESCIVNVYFFLQEIPLADGTVDAVLCDVPFGRKFSCSYAMPTVLPCLLREMERCVT
ncbi:THUMP domain-containing protein 2-like [Sinocyclocheilus grahami]|uniref:THUMP domain-containing protein 2-like n=1 Tax=Sinocyclocheilus grahami TaxID=75366 RepID=UPI0007AC9581|nr:PREDICTED: THUMP domain-containing protein 2-like [Sinocyclocheilus grahami]